MEPFEIKPANITEADFHRGRQRCCICGRSAIENVSTIEHRLLDTVYIHNSCGDKLAAAWAKR